MQNLSSRDCKSIQDKPCLLTRIEKDFLLRQAPPWKNGEKLKKGAAIKLSNNWLASQIILSHSIMMIEQKMYALHHTIAFGGFGKIKILEDLADGSFCVAKISSMSETLNEITYLLHNGLLRGSTVRMIKRKENELLLSKIYIVMPYLGIDLKLTLIEHAASNELTLQKRLMLAGEIATAVARLHGDIGGGSINCAGVAHKDLKPQNILIDKQGKIHIIDYGLSTLHLNKFTHMKEGTAGYVHFPPQNSVLSHADKRSNLFFDISMLRRVLHIDDKISVFDKRSVAMLQIDNYLENDYEVTGYVFEDTLTIKHAITFAAIWFAKLADLNTEEIGNIIAHKNLAAIVVGSYYNNKANPKFIWENGAVNVRQFWCENAANFHIYEKFVQYGLLEQWDAAIENTTFCKVLCNKHFAMSDSVKQALVCLFKHGLFSVESCHALQEKQELAQLCLEAHLYNDIEMLKDVISNSPKYTKYPAKYKESHMFLSAHIKNDAEEPLEGIKRLLSKFITLSDDENTILIQLNKKGAASWLYNLWLQRKSADLSLEQDAECIKYIYAFITHPQYQKVLLELYELYLQCAISHNNLDKILEEFWGANALINAQFVLELIACGGSLKKITGFLTGNFLDVITESKLPPMTVVKILNKTTTPLDFIKKFNKFAMSYQSIERLIILYNENRKCFDKLLARADLEVIDYIYANSLMSDAVIDTEDEPLKFSVIKFCLHYFVATHCVLALLRDDVFLKSLVVLQLMDNISAAQTTLNDNIKMHLNGDNVYILSTNAMLYEKIATYKTFFLSHKKQNQQPAIERQNGSISGQVTAFGLFPADNKDLTAAHNITQQIKEWLTTASICFNFKIAFDDLHMQYPELNKFIIEINDLVALNPNQRFLACRAIINIFYELDTLQKLHACNLVNDRSLQAKYNDLLSYIGFLTPEALLNTHIPSKLHAGESESFIKNLAQLIEKIKYCLNNSDFKEYTIALERIDSHSLSFKGLFNSITPKRHNSRFLDAIAKAVTELQENTIVPVTVLAYKNKTPSPCIFKENTIVSVTILADKNTSSSCTFR